MTTGICAVHNRPHPCLSCRGAKGGRVSSPKKSRANRAKSKFAANCRWKGRKAAVLGLVAFACFLFNYYGVNIFFSGLHSYAGLK